MPMKPCWPLLLICVVALSGCGSSCPLLCTDQTRLQRDYVAQRDQCQQVAEMKQGMEENKTLAGEQSKAKLVSLFSECMSTNGWAVPDPAKDKEKKNAATSAPVPTTAPAAVEQGLQPPQPAPSSTRTRRAAECAFARQAAASSPVSKNVAAACDLECKNAKKLAPEAPLSPACP